MGDITAGMTVYYINTLKQELSGSKAYKETSEEERSVVQPLALKCSVCVKERQYRLPTMYWLPKLLKKPYKARFIANYIASINQDSVIPHIQWNSFL